MRNSASVFAGVVIDVDRPWGTEYITKQVVERKVSYAPWQRAARLRTDGVDIAERTQLDTLGWVVGWGQPEVTTLAVTARWKGIDSDTTRVITHASTRIGDHLLLFTNAPRPDRWPEGSLLSPSMPLFETVRRGIPIADAGDQLFRIPDPVWRDSTRSPWPLPFDELIRDIKEGDAPSGLASARTLVRVCDRQDETAEALAVLLARAESDSIAEEVVEAFCDLRDPPLHRLAYLANHPRSLVRRAALSGIRSLGWRAYSSLDLMRRKLSDEDPIVRAVAAQALCTFEDDATLAYEELLAACADSAPDVRASSATAVGWIGPRDRRAVATLLNLLKDVDPLVRASAARAIGALGVDNEETRAALEAIERERDPSVRKGAKMGLLKLEYDWRERHDFSKRPDDTSVRPCG